jgi:hypothetical protein
MQTKFKGQWIWTEEFAFLQPRDMYHKEHDPARYTLQETDPQNVHTLFRRSFTLRKAPGSYILRISADDYAKYYVNGQFIGQGPAPDYLENYQYNEFDITQYLRDGDNMIMAHVYYQGLVNRVWISGDLRMGLIADLIGPDGQTLLYTDNNWEYAPIQNFLPGHTFGYKTQFAENFDSRIPLGEFRTARVRDDHGIRFFQRLFQPLDLCVLIRGFPGNTAFEFADAGNASPDRLFISVLLKISSVHWTPPERRCKYRSLSSSLNTLNTTRSIVPGCSFTHAVTVVTAMSAARSFGK